MRWKTEVEIGRARISQNDPTYFIADIAANHDGDLDRARKLIWDAKEAGADCAKFQHFVADKIVSAAGFEALGAQSAHQASWKRTVIEVYDAYHTRRDWTAALVETCRAANIEYMTTPYDMEAITAQAPHVPAMKVGSGDITFTPLLQACADLGKPVLLATGAATMSDVEQAVATLLARNSKLVLMQCNTNYTGSEDNFAHVNLNVLKTFALRWPGMPLGLSDHTPGHEAVLGAVALGARVIEKHFTDDNSREGPDHAFALDPVAWAAMVKAARRLESSMGTGIKGIEANESQTVVVQRRAIRARAALPVGHVLIADDVECLRPCPAEALDPRSLNEVIGRTLSTSIPAGQALTWSDLA